MFGEKQEKLKDFSASLSFKSKWVGGSDYALLSIALRISKSTKNKGLDFVQF